MKSNLDIYIHIPVTGCVDQKRSAGSSSAGTIFFSFLTVFNLGDIPFVMADQRPSRRKGNMSSSDNDTKKKIVSGLSSD